MRIANGIFVILLILFSAAQYNDPDGLFWVGVYGAGVIWCAIAAFHSCLFTKTPVFGLFALTMLAALGFIYGVELAQAVFLLMFPVTIIGGFTLSTARLIDATQPQGEDLYRILFRQRLWTQIIGMVAIFITALYGMFQNLAIVRWL